MRSGFNASLEVGNLWLNGSGFGVTSKNFIIHFVHHLNVDCATIETTIPHSLQHYLVNLMVKPAKDAPVIHKHFCIELSVRLRSWWQIHYNNPPLFICKTNLTFNII